MQFGLKKGNILVSKYNNNISVPYEIFSYLIRFGQIGIKIIVSNNYS